MTPTPIPMSATNSGPAAMVFDGCLNVIYRSLTNRLVWQSSPDGTNWGEPVELDASINSSDQPVAFLYGPPPFPQPYVFYKGVSGDNGIYYTSSSSAQWVAATALDPGVNTSAGPTAIAPAQSFISIFYKGEADDQNIYMTTQQSGVWTSPQSMNWLTDVAPGAVFDEDSGFYQVYYKNPNPDARISLQSTPAPSLSKWSSSLLPDGVNTSDAPGPIISGGRLNVFYKGEGADQSIYVAYAVLPTSAWDSIAWSSMPLTSGEMTSAGPKAVIYSGQLYLFYKGAGTDTRVYVSQYQGMF